MNNLSNTSDSANENLKPHIERQQIRVEPFTPNQPYTLQDWVNGTDESNKTAGLQDAIKAPRTEDELEQQRDMTYQAVYGHEADLPIIYEWMENVPEWAFYREIIQRYVAARNGRRFPGIEWNIPDGPAEELQAALKAFFTTVEEIRDRHTKPRWTPEDIRGEKRPEPEAPATPTQRQEGPTEGHIRAYTISDTGAENIIGIEDLPF